MGTRSALIVANDSYQDPGLRQLRAPGIDARALESVLADPAIGGFDVRVVANESESRLRREVAAFFAARAHDDLLLAHFSCHGVKDDGGQLYFATRDTDLTSLDATAVPAEFVNRQMTRSRSRRVVLLLDCCYSGAFARGMLNRADEAVDLKDRFEGRGRIVLTASSSMEYAFEDAELTRADGHPSIFTGALVRGLETGEADRDRDGRVSVDELYDYLFDEVRKLTPKQTPGRWNFEVQGDLLIARSPQVRPAPLPLELQQAIEHPIAGMRLAAVEELARLLRSGHAGLALAAREALDLLAGDDSQRVRSAAGAVLEASPGVPAGLRQAPDPAVPPAPATLPATAPATVPAAPAAPARGRVPTAGRLPGGRPAARVGTVAAPPATTRLPGGHGRPLLALLLVGSLAAALLAWAILATRGPDVLAAGQEFSATAPWRLQVAGSDCQVTVSPIADQGYARTARGSDYSLQMRMSGSFVLKELTGGCQATVAGGTGGKVGLPFEARGGSRGAGGDSRPFVSPVSAKVTASGADCTTDRVTSVYDSRDGRQVDRFYGSGTLVVGRGEFYVGSDARCTVQVAS
ncbi:MAG TPA: caspase family protein [Actinomycetota bacterium]|jgi:hypothetical protein